MRRAQIVWIALFLAGILMGGVGAGIAVLEYTSFSYGGEILVGEEYLVTKELDFELPEGEDKVVLARNQFSRDNLWQLKEDETVPEDVLCYQVTYNQKELEPFLELESVKEMPEDGPEEEAICGVLNLAADYYYNDNIEEMMNYKDQFLKDLKQKKFSTYRMEYITQVTIRINPKTMERIEAEWR